MLFPGARALIDLARKRGARAIHIAMVRWEPLLAELIDEVRGTLGIGPPPSYTRYVRDPSGFGLVPEKLPN